MSVDLIRDYVKKNKNQFSKESLRTVLSNGSFSKEDIDKVLNEEYANHSKPKKESNNFFIIFIILVLLIIGGIFLYFMWVDAYKQSLEDKIIQGSNFETEESSNFETEENSNFETGQISSQRLENGTVYIKNEGNINILGATVSVSATPGYSGSCTDNRTVNLAKKDVNKVTLPGCSLTADSVYTVLVITDTGIFKDNLIAN